MSNISQFITTSRKKNRRIIHGGVGVTTVTWLVPPGVTEVEVHCWGAGGSAAPGISPAPTARGGGGGGYVTHVFPVTPSDRLLITAGAAPGGTSSVSVPTQSPGSPISATGGSAGPGGAGGGSGSYTIAPGISTSRTFSASGGAGLYGGGAAGSPFGKGGDGNWGGAGIGGAGGGPDSVITGGGGGSLGAALGRRGGLGKNGYRATAQTPGGVSNDQINIDDWFYVDEILGGGGESKTSSTGNGGAGGGGSYGINGPTVIAGSGGILGGGGAGTYSPTPNSFDSNGGGGGLAGGGGMGSGTGGAGLVILYW